MSPDGGFEEPAPEAVRDAAAAVLGCPVSEVTQIPRGVNALFRLSLEDGRRVVLKAPRYANEDAFLAEPAVLSTLRRETAVPVPRVLATVGRADGPLELPHYVMAHLDGRQVHTVPDVSPANRERLVREAAEHLAAVHGVRTGESFGPLHLVDDDLTADPSFDDWAPMFEDLVTDVTRALRGEGQLTDAEPRFADLAPVIREALNDHGSAIADVSPARAFVLRDYRPANLLLAPRADADPLVTGVVDVSGFVGDALLDVAKAEDALIDVPLGGTDEAERLRTTFRTTYARRRGTERRALFDDRYPWYRLYARAYRLKAFDYSVQFARESDPETVARRWRSFVADRLAEIRGR